MPRPCREQSGITELRLFVDRNGSRAGQLLNGAPCLVNSAVGVSVGARVGVGDCQTAKGLAGGDAGKLATFQPKLVEQGVVLVSVAVRPAVDCDGGYVARWIEAATEQRARQLVANVVLKRLEGS